MRKLVFSLFALILLVAGCNQGPASEDIAKLAYEWEKANFDRDYEREQELIYGKGSYEIHKTTIKKESGLKYEDIRYEIFFDEELERYYVFADFKNPNGENSVEDNIVFRKKDDEWKVDVKESVDVVREDITDQLDREACINCE
ncbi:hypothetical protein J7I93_09200 [Bacillus sp. ISL-47]|uniref:hypothetical protein n=1 Tax=Bacillus sp. ISL-47 TaxID=2819130 RepID=UPI001BEAF540|nr:hypothetical protein [Bacillus sp. ISL-47]MBT2688357.1 hypothetical protein [Bacillus sp. ISL-47]MBT2710532.1 hypothetical protein [Pseudomonas sp. ISL-84]